MTTCWAGSGLGLGDTVVEKIAPVLMKLMVPRRPHAEGQVLCSILDLQDPTYPPHHFKTQVLLTSPFHGRTDRQGEVKQLAQLESSRARTQTQDN